MMFFLVYNKYERYAFFLGFCEPREKQKKRRWPGDSSASNLKMAVSQYDDGKRARSRFWAGSHNHVRRPPLTFIPQHPWP